MVFIPVFKFMVPVPVTVASLSFGVAVTWILDFSNGTVPILYDNKSSLNPVMVVPSTFKSDRAEISFLFLVTVMV